MPKLNEVDKIVGSHFCGRFFNLMDEIIGSTLEREASVAVLVFMWNVLDELLSDEMKEVAKKQRTK